MKKILSLLLVLATILCFCACGENVDSSVYSVGDPVETDILKFTLENAQFAIKLNTTSYGTYSQLQSGNTTISEEYFTAEEYNPATDAGSAYVAPKGHTYIAIECKVENLDRASVDIGKRYVKASYNKNEFKDLDINYGCDSVNGYAWERYDGSNIVLLAGETKYFRAYVDIPVDVESLEDEFDLTFYIPNSKGKTEGFKYRVAGGTIENLGMSLDEAIYKFTSDEGQDYFKERISDYTTLSGGDIASLLNNRKSWNMVIKYSYGSWTGKFKFEDDLRIKETLSDGSTGYFNKRSWIVEGDNLVLDNKDICKVLKLSDDSYLLTVNNEPYAIMN